MPRPLRIAVIGSGISGLSAAWLLGKTHDVTLFDRENRVGGHSNTVDVPVPNGLQPVDTGFIVYNTACYQNLIALFDHLRVPTATTNMGFAVSLDQGGYEYSGDGLRGLFGQARNAFRPSHWRMLADMLRFFREARALLASNSGTEMTLGAYLTENRYSQTFITRHILPMAAAIWSTPSADVMAFPLAAFVRFFDNHGLLQVSGRPEWRTVAGGSREYVKRILADFNGRVVLRSPIQSIVREAQGATITHAGGRQSFDACVVAAHADEALALLGDADDCERRLLGAFRYSNNRAVLHRDPGFMPQRRSLWSSWNYLGSGAGAHDALAVTYWMNKLQPLGATEDIFVTLNPHRPLQPGAEIAAFDYMHPMFDQRALAAQRDLWSLQGRRNTWFCGSYFGFGFHEDALQSGLAAAEAIGGVRRPWTVRDESSRLHFGPQSNVAPALVREAAE
jgi:uncharacterized protein